MERSKNLPPKSNTPHILSDNMTSQDWKIAVYEKCMRAQRFEQDTREPTNKSGKHTNKPAKKSGSKSDIDFDRYWKVQGSEYFKQDFLRSAQRYVAQWCNNSTFDFGRFIEHGLVFLYDMSRADTLGSRVMACVSFIQKETDIEILSIEFFERALNHGTNLVNAILEFYDMMFVGPTDGPELQSSEDTFAFFHKMLDKYDEVKESEMVQKFQRFGLYALSLSLFTKFGLTFKRCGYSKVEEQILRRKYTMGPSFIHCIMDSILYVCEKGHQCIISGSLDPIIHGGTEYAGWFKKVTILREQALYMSDPEALSELKARGVEIPETDQFKFLADVDELIEQGIAIQKFAKKLRDYERTALNCALGNLQLLRANSITKRAAQKMRQAPFSLLVSGGSSVGKSSLVDLIFYQVGKTLHLPCGTEFKYTRNFMDKFWSGFHPSMWFLILDDVAYMNPNKAPNGDPSLMEAIGILNRVPLVTNQADLVDKGRSPCRAKCVVATTNTPKLNASSYYSCPLALKRRFPYMIDVAPKACFARDGQMMDAEKVSMWKGSKTDSEVFDDIWDIKLFRLVPEVRLADGRDYREGQDGSYVRIDDMGMNNDSFVFHDIYAFLAWLSKMVLIHQKNEDMMDNAGREAATIAMCEKCFYPVVRCKCARIQAGETFSFGPLGTWLVAVENARVNYFKEYVNVQGIEDFVRPKLANVMSQTVSLIDYVSWWNTIKFTCLYPFFFAFMNIGWFRTSVVWSYFKITGNKIGMEMLFYSGWFWWMSHGLIKRLGCRAAREFAVPKGFHSMVKQASIVCAAGVLTTVILTWILRILFPRKEEEKKFQGMTESTSTESMSVGQKPVALPKERTNAWQQVELATTTFDVAPESRSRSKDDFDEFVNLVGKNCVSLVSENYGIDGARKRGKAICVTGHIYLTNNHVLPVASQFDLTMISGVNCGCLTRDLTIKVTQSQIHRFPEQDLALFEITNLPPRKDIRSLFALKTLRGSMNGTLLSMSQKGQFEKRVVKSAHLTQGVVDGISAKDFWIAHIDRPTVNGDCGSLMVATSGLGPILLGIHVAGMDDNVMSLPVTREFLMEETTKFTHIPVQSGAPMLDAPSAKRVLSPMIHFKSPINWSEAGNVAGVYGSFLGFRSHKRSDVEATLMAPVLEKSGYETKYGAPAMGWEPWHVALDDLVNPVTQLDQGLLKECADAYADEIIAALGDDIKNTVHILDMDTTINGAPGVAYIDAMKRSTSAGCPWKKSKKFFFKEANSRNGLQNPVDVDDEIMERVEEMRERYLRGERCMPCFNGCAKDEARKFKKIAAKNTRIFTGSPVDFSIIVRQYLLSIARLFQNNRFVCESAPGTNAHSHEWEEIREYLTAFGQDRLVAGDYAAFDKRMSSSVILIAFYVIRRICEASGNYAMEDLQVIAGIAEDIAFPLVDYNGDLIEFLGSNPSGHVLTVIINCIANCLYMRYTYAQLGKVEEPEISQRTMVRTFKENVRLITYGDDNAMGVSPSRPWFNHTRIQEELGKVGITYTMADKEARSVPYIDIDHVSFLKRTWRWDDELKAYVCPLEHESIEKSLMVSVRSRTITKEEQALEIMHSAVMEYFWYGREVFDIKRELLIETAHEIGITWLLAAKPFPTWETLERRFNGTPEICENLGANPNSGLLQ